MMVVEKATGKIIDSDFKEFPNFLGEEDLLVINNTKVIPAKFFVKDSKDRRVEILILKETEEGLWEALCKPARRLKKGINFKLEGVSLEGEVFEEGEMGRRFLRFHFSRDELRKYLNEHGYAPLPPYIKREKNADSLREKDLEFYQTIWAKFNGSIAAPTAGIHFTKEIMERIKEKGIKIVEITLHVGEATFRPVRVKEIEKHKMGEEYVFIDDFAADVIESGLKKRKRIVAVGTTVVRALESSFYQGKIRRNGFLTDLFIYPPFKFNVVSSLLTNFHLPKSTLFILVSSFAGLDLMKKAYSEAIKKKYKFFSYGDCMLIL